MKMKILSLIIIAILAISAIGTVSAGTLTLNYPGTKPSPDYRWSGDTVDIFDTPIADTWGSKYKGFNNQYNLADLDGKSFKIVFTDGTTMSIQKATLKINNYNGGDVYVNFWDRGYVRDPHIDATYNGQYKNGKNGDDITFN